MFKNTSGQKLLVFAFDSTTNLPKTGDSANITAYVSKDYGSATVLGDTSATEVDSTNAKGYYLFDLTQSETDANTLIFTAKSSTANIVVIGVPATVFTVPANFTATSIDSSGRLDIAKIAGTAQTARDIGASVLLSPGTGTGQVSLSSGAVTVGTNNDKTGYSLSANDSPVIQNGTAQAGAASTITLSSGASATDDIYNGQTVKLTGGTGAGQVRVIIGYVGSTKVATVNRSWQTNPDATTTYTVLATDSPKTNSLLEVVSSSISGVTFPANFSSLSITAGGLVDITQAAADKVWSTATRRLTDGTNIVLAKGTGITGFNDIAATAIVSGGAINTNSGSVSTVTSVTNGVTVSTNNDKTGYSLSTNDSPVIHNGTSQAGAGSTITLAAGASATNDVYNGQTIKLTGGTGAGQVRVILSYVGSTKVATINRAWQTNPDNTTTYAILATDSPKTNSSLEVTASAITGVTFPTNFSALSITAGGLVDITQAAADKAWSTSTRILTAGTNIVLAKGTGITGFNDLTAAQIATGVWQDTTSGDFTVSGSIGKSLFTSGNTPGSAGGLFIAGTNAATTVTTSFTTTFTGNLTGSVASVTNPVSVNSISNNTITAASIADGAIDRATFADDTGLKNIRANTAQAGASTTITLDASASSTNNYYNNTLVYITGGTGIGQARFITAYNGTTKVATVNSAWTTNPDNTSTFAILPFDSIPGVTAPTAAQVATAVWTDLLAGSDFSTASSVGKLLKDNVDATVSSRMATFTLPTNFSSLVISAGGVVDANVESVDPSVIGSATLTSQSITDIVTAVWTDTTAGDFTVSGSIGKSLFTSGNTPGTAGGLFIAGSNAATTVNITGSITSVTNGVTVSTNNDKTGYSLTQAFPSNFASLSINGSGLVDITQTAADKVWSTSTRILTAGTNIVLAKGTGITGFNDIAATSIVSAGAITTNAGAVVKVDSLLDDDSSSYRSVRIGSDNLMGSNTLAIAGDSAAATIQSSANKVIYKGSVTSAIGATSFTDSALPNTTNNNWKGRVIVFLTGALQYQATDITSNTGTSLTFTALTGTPSVSDEYLIF